MELYEENFDIKSTDEDLLATAKQWYIESKSYHDELKKKQDIAEMYYVGDQTDKNIIASHNSNTVENRIFEAVETLAPIATASAHHFLVLPGTEDELSVDKANKLGKVLERKYQTLNIQQKLEKITRHMLLKRFGVAKWCWDEVTDDIDVKVIDPRLIFVPKMNVDPHDIPYKMELQDYTRKEIEEYFPDVEPDDLVMETVIDEVTKNKKKVYRLFEVWTSEMVAWVSGNFGKVLDKKANPYWDFEGSEKKYVSNEKKIDKKLVFRNHLNRPVDPYVFFTTFDVTDEPFGSVALVDIGIPLQDAINVQKRQIIDNLRRMGNGQVYIDSDAMSQEEAENITNEVGLVIRGEGVASQNKVRREPGTPLPEAHFSNLTHTEAMFDNIMGTHGATRGAGASKTLGQDIMSRQQDYTRVDLITRVLNRGVARLADGLVQLMRMYYDESKVIKILGEDGAVEFIKMSRDDIEDHIEIEVRSGNALPLDKVALRTEAIQLWQLGALDPVTLFEVLEKPNPEKMANRLVAWKQGQLTMETQQQIQLAAVQSQLGAQAKAKEISAKGEEDVRKVETSANVMQRAKENLGGGAASLPKTPNLTGEKKE